MVVKKIHLIDIQYSLVNVCQYAWLQCSYPLPQRLLNIQGSYYSVFGSTER